MKACNTHASLILNPVRPVHMSTLLHEHADMTPIMNKPKAVFLRILRTLGKTELSKTQLLSITIPFPV